MIEFSKWAESHNLNSVKNQLVFDRKELGMLGFDGLQDIIEALKIVSKNNPTIARSLISGLAGKLTVLIGEAEPELARRLRQSGSKFAMASSKIQDNLKGENL